MAYIQTLTHIAPTQFSFHADNTGIKKRSESIGVTHRQLRATLRNSELNNFSSTSLNNSTRTSVPLRTRTLKKMRQRQLRWILSSSATRVNKSYKSFAFIVYF